VHRADANFGLIQVDMHSEKSDYLDLIPLRLSVMEPAELGLRKEYFSAGIVKVMVR
jgi:hypothetical protein